MYPSLVLVQPRKTRPCLTERLLMGRKESNQTTNKQNKYTFFTAEDEIFDIFQFSFLFKLYNLKTNHFLRQT